MADDLLAFNISGDEEEAEVQGEEGSGGTGQPQQTKAQSRQDKLHQTEEAFQQVKARYQVKIEDGEIWKSLKATLLPFSEARAAVSKPEAQELLHAVEELYFFRRYAEGAEAAAEMLADDNLAARLDVDVKATLELYHGKCLHKASAARETPAPGH